MCKSPDVPLQDELRCWSCVAHMWLWPTWIASMPIEGWLVLSWLVHVSSSSCKGTSGLFETMAAERRVVSKVEAKFCPFYPSAVKIRRGVGEIVEWEVRVHHTREPLEYISWAVAMRCTRSRVGKKITAACEHIYVWRPNNRETEEDCASRSL